MIIVDFSHLYFRNVLANKQTIIDNPEYCAHILLTSLYYIINTFSVTKENPLLIAIDFDKESYWRTKFYAEHSKKFPEYQGLTYKGNRVVDATIPWDEVKEIMKDVIQFLKTSTDLVVLEHKLAEADDIIYVMSKLFNHTTIISSDKDFKQLISDKVSIYDPIKREYLVVTDPTYFLERQILTGDKSDNIKNCKRGIGEKTAEKMMKNLKGWLELDPDLTERYNFNKILIDLSEIPDWIEEEIESLISHDQGNYNFKEVINFFRKYKLRKLSERIDKMHIT